MKAAAGMTIRGRSIRDMGNDLSVSLSRPAALELCKRLPAWAHNFYSIQDTPCPDLYSPISHDLH